MLAQRDLSYHGPYKKLGNFVLQRLGEPVGRARACTTSSRATASSGSASLAHALDFYKGYKYSETVEVAVVMSRLGYRVRNDHVVPVPVSRSRTRLRDAVIDLAVIPVAASACPGAASRLRRPRVRPRRPGAVALGVMLAFWLVVLGWYLAHRIVLSSDSMNNYVHVWWIAAISGTTAISRGGCRCSATATRSRTPTASSTGPSAALLWPLFGNWASRCDHRARRGRLHRRHVLRVPRAAARLVGCGRLANPAIIEALLFGQQAFAWGAMLLLFGVACWRRDRRLAAALLVGFGQATHPAIVLPIGSCSSPAA